MLEYNNVARSKQSILIVILRILPSSQKKVPALSHEGILIFPF